MTDVPAVYLVGPPGPFRERAAAPLQSLSPRTFDEVDAFVEADPSPGVAYLLAAALGGDGVLRALDHMAVGRGEWTPVVVHEEGDELVGRTLSVGYAHPLAETVEGVRGEAPEVLLELRDVLTRIARARHDINNPLTSALAETQLLLMDSAEDEEVRENVEVVLEQLRRIRDLVSATVHLRPLD